MCLPAAFAAIPAMASSIGTAFAAAAPTLTSIASTAGSILANPITQLALTGLGTAAQIRGQNQQQQAQEDAMWRENQRQKQYRESQETVTNALLNNTRPNVVQEDIVRNERRFEKRSARARKNEPSLRNALPGQGRASRSVGTSGALDAASREGRTNKISQALSRSAGYRRADIGQKSDQLNAFNKMQQNSIFARNSANVLPLEMTAAASKGQGSRTLGDALLALGTAASLTNGFSGLFFRPQTAAQLAANGPRVGPMLRPTP